MKWVPWLPIGMVRKVVGMGVMLGMLWMPGILSAATGDSTSASAPSAHLPETLYEFPPAMEGDTVSHEFVIQNRGNALLQILGVKAG